MSALPPGWASASLSQICKKIVDGSHNPPKGVEFGVPMLSARDICARKINFSGGRLISNEDFQVEHKRTNIQAGDVLLTIVGSIGRTAIVGSELGPFALQRSVAVLKPLEVEPRYLAYVLESPSTQKCFEENAKGTAQKGIYLKALGEVGIPLAPVAEQKRIADKLDALFARVDASRARLDRIPTLLKRFRQSVLAAATSGQLTEDWRQGRSLERAKEIIVRAAGSRAAAQLRLRAGPQRKPSLADLPLPVELPKDWVVTCFDELAEADRNALKAGPFGSALKKDMYVPKGYKVYGQEQVISGDEKFGDYYIAENKYQELKSCAVKSGDILISLVGTIGRVLVLSESAEMGIINPRLVKLSLYKDISRNFIAFYLQSQYSQLFFRERSHGGTMDVLNLGLLRELPILLPPLEEQEEVVRRVESLFAIVDAIEARYASIRARLERLTPALLAKAFRGELVSQDPSDEPADQLLARIRASAPEKARPKKSSKKTESA